MPKQFRDENVSEEGPSDGEKPLKKARFVWELKGKHHLKETHKNNPVNNNNVDEEITAEQSINSPIQQANSSKNNNTIVENIQENNQLTTQSSSQGKKSREDCNSCCLQTLLERTTDDINNELDELSNEIDYTMGSPNPKNQEYYLLKWQARQIARGFVDNTINSVLENWSHRPLDVVELLDNYDNDGQVEDDAILMAIQSHGLQSTNSRSEVNSGIEQQAALERDPGIQEFTHDNLENVENERMREQESNNILNGNSGSSYLQVENFGAEETMDFLNAAVSVAIQKKGLSYGY